jgi:hypothetical protein
MKIVFYAVLHCTVAQFVKVAALAQRVFDKITEFAALYTTPDPALNLLKIEIDKLNTLIGEAKGNSLKKAERDAQCEVVFDMLVKECKYANTVADGDKVKVLKSGFDADKTPESHGAPGTPVISSIVDGPELHSGKVKLAGPLPRGARYTVQTFEIPSNITPPIPPVPGGPPDPDFDPDELPWKEALESVSSRELVIPNLKKGKDTLVRVRAEDRSKKSNWSDMYLFMPR